MCKHNFKNENSQDQKGGVLADTLLMHSVGKTVHVKAVNRSVFMFCLTGTSPSVTITIKTAAFDPAVQVSFQLWASFLLTTAAEIRFC